MVLCIDDEPMVLATRKLVLQSAGFRVITSNSVRQGLEILSTEEVDAVVLNDYLSDGNGLALAGVIRHTRPAIAILMISADTCMPDSARGVVDAFIGRHEGPQAMLNSLCSLFPVATHGQGGPKLAPDDSGEL